MPPIYYGSAPFALKRGAQALNLYYGSTLISGGAAKVDVDYVVMLGSSTTDFTFGPSNNQTLGDQKHAVRAAISSAGIDVPILTQAVGGSGIASLDTNVNTYISNLGSLTGKKVAFIINIGSNDIGIASFASMAQPTKDAMVAGLTSIVGKIFAAGHIPIIATVNGRNTYELMYDEWAVNMFEPLCQSLTPNWYKSGTAVFDYCQLYIDNIGVANWYNPDNVHPWMASPALQAYTAQKIVSTMNVPAKSANEKVVIAFYVGGNGYAGGVNNIVATVGSSSIATVYNSWGELKSGATFSYAGASGGGTSVRPDVGDHAVSVSNKLLHKTYLYSSPGNHTLTFAMGGAYANRVGVAKCAFNTSNAARVSRFTIGASSADVTGNAAGVQYGTVPFTADAVGNIVITVSPASGTYASTSGVELEFNPA